MSGIPDNIRVPVHQFFKMAIDDNPASFGNVEIERDEDINYLDYIEQNTDKEILIQEVEQDIIDNESAKEYNVEKILDHKFNKEGKLQYLLKWEGWSSKYNTWENQENVFADKLIKKYWKKKESIIPSLEEKIEGSTNDRSRNDEKLSSPHFLDRSSLPKQTRNRSLKRINCDIDVNEDIISSSTHNITAEINRRARSEQEVATTSKSTVTQTQLYPPPMFLQRIKPSLMKEFFDPEIRDPKESLDWDEDSISIEFLELDDQGRIVGYLNWKSGNRSRHFLDELHAKCPRKMLEFYKKNIHFELENETKDYKTLKKFRSTRRTTTRWNNDLDIV
ncbi:hypothetical protein C1645_733603 [Glomus cerebriforme]|uniref:Chromo domain-containing protein n=1 Tax=Glomus cerebriforme TaxID=658196 RepID=A0A397TCQ7_9GLOM|nr:hypothetical protein C1645_733603 [Glomus cerebriforme]